MGDGSDVTEGCTGQASSNAEVAGFPRSLPRADVPELVPARMINELLYCERLMYLEWAQGEWADNAFTLDGNAVHRRADKPGRPLAEPSTAAGEGGEPDPPYTARSVWLSSERLEITGKTDIVEVDGGRVVPVEYKRGKQPAGEEPAYLPERAQLCAQVLLLREHGYRCDEAMIYFAGDRRRVSVPIDGELEATVLKAVRRAKAVAAAGVLPLPLVDSPKCQGCSLVGICLPDEVTWLRKEREDACAGEPDANLDGAPETENEPKRMRRLHAARDERLPLYVTEQGARIGLSAGRLRVSRRDGTSETVRLTNTSQVALFGNVQLTTQALRKLMSEGIPVAYYSYGGRLVGRVIGPDSKNVELRLAQFGFCTDPVASLRLARGLIASKIRNCRTLLRRNSREDLGEVLRDLKRSRQQALQASSLEKLLGYEGNGARIYFGAFSQMLAPNGAGADFDFHGRNRRPPRDPVNALLSFCYALLTKDCAAALTAVGLDAMLGAYHQPRFGRPSLALDVMEEFRPIIADSVVISTINNGVVGPSDFLIGVTGVSLKAPARRRLILAYERRIDHLVTHPLFGYRVSYRRILEIQARLLSRHMLGEIEHYPSFETR